MRSGCLYEEWLKGDMISIFPFLLVFDTNRTSPLAFMLGTSSPLARVLRRIWEKTLMDWPRARRKDMGTPVTRAISM